MIAPSATRRRQVAAALGIGALVAATLGGTAAMADASPSNIDPDAKGSITIHKLETPEDGASGANNSGVELTPGPSASPVEGVTFEIQRVDGIDLTTFEGWEDLEGLEVGDIDPNDLIDAGSEATGANGIASFTGLGLGVYLVTETDKPAHVTSTVAPFLLLLPTPVDNEWNYDVHVYPKNSITEINKTVEANAHKAIGDDIVWTITGGVPILSGDEVHTKYEMRDNLPAEVTYTGSVVKIDGTEVTDPGLYDVTTDANGNPTLVFTADGLDDLKGASEVTWEITTEVIALSENGILKNDAGLTVNDSEELEDSDQQEWGGIEINKFAKDSDNTLQGAEFQLFASQEDAGNKANPIEVAGEDTFTTDENGVVDIVAVQTGTYYLVETKAPAGYSLDDTPIEVEVSAGGVNDLVEVEVENVQKPQLELPPLGAAGMVGAMAAGAMLIIAGGAIVIRNRRAGNVV